MPFVGEKRRNAHIAAIDAAAECGIKRLVYTSIVGAGVEENDAYEIADHKVTEQYIRSKGIGYVILRDSQYAEAMVSAYEEAFANTGGVLSNNMGDGLMAFVARFDCAEAAASVACGAGAINTVYYISGPEAITVSEYLRIASQVTGNRVSYKYITDEEAYAFFDSIGVPRTTDGEWAKTASNFPFCGEGMVTFGRAIRLGQMSNCTNDFEMLTGKKPLSVKEIFERIDEHRIGVRVSTD
jgi:NAD(P)H dehydrogenase (quinone)